MTRYEQVTDTVEVPRNTGVEGFLRVLRIYLSKPRVQEINIDSRGKVTVRRWAPANDGDRNAGVDFGDLQPHGIVRNAQVEEVLLSRGANAAAALGALLDMVAQEHLVPLAFMTGAGTVLWSWYCSSTGYQLRSKDTLHGLPLHTDIALPDTALILAAGYGRDAALVDTRTAYKIEIPTQPNEVEEVCIL